MNKRKIWFADRIKMFKSLHASDIEALEKRTEQVRFKRRHVIFMPGDPGDRIYLIKSGLVKISKVTEEGKELTLSFLTQGDVFGELALTDCAPRSTMAEACEDSVLSVIERDHFLPVILSKPASALAFAQLVASRRRKLEDRLDSLLFKGAHARLAGLFIDLAQEFGVRDSRGTIINLKLTHREMANFIGSTRETVSFALLDLKKESLIETSERRVIIVDSEGLEKLAEGR